MNSFAHIEYQVIGWIGSQYLESTLLIKYEEVCLSYQAERSVIWDAGLRKGDVGDILARLAVEVVWHYGGIAVYAYHVCAFGSACLS